MRYSIRRFASPLRCDIPALLESACLKALAKRPTDRHASAKELGRAVEIWQEVARKDAEQALRESEALYHSLVETMPLILVRKDLESRFTFGNTRFSQAIGKPIEEILGKTDFDIGPTEVASQIAGRSIRISLSSLSRVLDGDQSSHQSRTVLHLRAKLQSHRSGDADRRT